VSHDWLLELGHSRLKLGRLVDGTPGAVEAIAPAHFGRWLAMRRPGPRDRFWLAAVPLPNVTQRVTDVLTRADLEWRMIATDSTALPVMPSYPGMGVDRWLAIQPVWTRLRSAFCLADCGTATTIDLVDARGVHVGGWIMPGADAARDGLLARAPGLRRPTTANVETYAPARDTAEAIERGLLLQQAGGILQACRAAVELSEFDETPVVILTGGAAGSIQSLLATVLDAGAEGVSIEPDLVLHGLAMAVESMNRQ